MQSNEMAGNQFLFEMLRSNNPALPRLIMSQQLTLSSLFSALALAGLCVVTTLGGLAGGDAQLAAPAIISVQAEPLPGLLP